MGIASTLTGSGYEVALLNAAAAGFTWAGKPAATAVPVGTVIRITDYGVPCLFMMSDGVRWVPAFPQILARGAGTPLTGTTNETALATITIPDGLLGVDGTVMVDTTWTYTNSANNKTLRVRFGGASGTQYGQQAVTTTATLHDQREIGNSGSASSQVSSHIQAMGTVFSSSTAATVTSSVDTTSAVDLLLTGQLASSGETIALPKYTVWLRP